MNQFDHRTQANRTLSTVPGVSCGKQQQSRPEALAAALQQITRNFRYGLNRRAILERKLLLNLHQVVAHEIEYFLRRQK
jgi:hypothetical protein